MRLIALRSMNGGAGATSLVAGLCAVLHSVEKQAVLALDLSPSNLLRLHFAMPWRDGNGLLPALGEGRPWYSAAYATGDGIRFIPYGQSTGDDDEALILEFLTRNGGLRRQLKALELPDDCWVMADCPSSQDRIADALFEMADLHVRVINADPASYALLQQASPPQPLLINRFDPRLQIDRDIGDLLRYQYQGQVLPVTIHRDESVREALACRKTLREYAPDSLALHDLTSLATWLRAHVPDEASS